MSLQLINRSPDLKRLRDEGYEIEIRSAHLVVKSVPYLNSQKEIRRGTLVSTLTLAGEITTVPDDHQAHFSGELPCNEDGSALSKILNSSSTRSLGEGLTIDHSFSAKPKTDSGRYENYYDKVTTYVAILSGPAQAIDPSQSAKTFAVSESGENESPFKYCDTASSRAEIGAITAKLEGQKIAIIGTGGTGSYVLDLVTKTPVKEIHVFDGDLHLQHNAFRSPGATSLDELKSQPNKAQHFAAIYSKMHRGVVAHPKDIDGSNVHLLKEMNFVFICIDRGTPKKLIIEKLEEFGISFIDVGMGLFLADNSIGGIMRVTASTPQSRTHIRNRVSFKDGDGNNEYDKNIQIAELNALNAALAVIKWKKMIGFYLDLENENFSAYTLDGNAIRNEDLDAK